MHSRIDWTDRADRERYMNMMKRLRDHSPNASTNPEPLTYVTHRPRFRGSSAIWSFRPPGRNPQTLHSLKIPETTEARIRNYTKQNYNEHPYILPGPSPPQPQNLKPQLCFGGSPCPDPSIQAGAHERRGALCEVPGKYDWPSTI